MDTVDLYRGPLEDFVARRTALARELRRTDPEAAAALSRLRRPSAGVWAIDQLAADDPSLVVALLAAGADTRDAQRNVAAGAASREALLDARGRLRDAVEAAARAAIATIERDKHGTSDETARRIRSTLQSAATGGAAERHALWTGTLTHDLDVAGFGAAQEPEEDSAELADALSTIRRPAAGEPRPADENRAVSSLDDIAQRAAERTAALQAADAERARAAAVAARQDADRLAEEAHDAAEKASAAEQAANAAEEAARAAHAALLR